MSEPAKPELQPIAAAFQAAVAQRAAEDEAARAAAERDSFAARQRAEDEAYFIDCLRRKGEAMARKFGRGCGFTEDEIEALLVRAADEAAEKAGKIKGKRKNKGEAEARRPSDGYPEPDAGGAGSAPPGDPEERFRREKQPIKPLPEDCPVVPVGYQATTCYYLNPGKQLIEMSKGSHNAEGIRLLFGTRQDWLWANFPKYNEKTGHQSGWKADRLAESLIAAAADKGVFDPLGVMRGLGGWRAEDGRLALHCGNQILIGDEAHDPGFIGPHLYPGARAGVKPAAPARDDAGRQAERDTIDRLLRIFDSWQWQDGTDQDEPTCYAADIDGTKHKLASILLLGWCGGARAGGAVRYRPVVWLTGDAGSGKSTLLDTMELVLGSDVIKASDPTAAGIWQTVGQSSRPILVDEAENEQSGTRMQAIVKLARQAATGGLVLRGSSGHAATQFRAQSAFMFGSIIVPSLLAQDMSRMAILELGPLPKGAQAKIDEAFLAHAGRVLMRRLLGQWHRWDEALHAYRAALALEGHSARGCDQYGTLLAMADLLRADELAHADTIQAFAKALNREKLDQSQYVATNAEAMLNHLISVPLDVFRGGTRMTIGRLVALGAGVAKPEGEDVTAKKCQEALEAWGVFIDGFEIASSRQGSRARVILPNQNAGLGKLFADTDWRAHPGAPGGWAQALKRLPGAQPVNSRRFGGRATSVPVHVFLQSDWQEDA